MSVEYRPFVQPLPVQIELPGQKIEPTTLVDFTKRQEQPAKVEFFSSQWLQEQVTKEQQKPALSHEVPWYHLAGTGFWVKEQTAQLLRNTRETMKTIAPNVVDLELQKVKVDMLAFEDEYLKQLVNLKFNLAWKEVHGEKRIVCPDYGNVLWEGVTDKNEREGAVYDAIAGNKEKGIVGLEEKLRNAPEGSIGIAISNEGWSGLTDADGQSITFPETQIYLIKKVPDNKLQAYTLRYKANIAQNEALQRYLGLEVTEAVNGRERIKNLITNTTLLTPEDAVQARQEGRKPVTDFTDVIDLMQQVVGGREVAYEGKTFDEMRAFLTNPEAFSKKNAITEQLIHRFQAFARDQLQEDQPAVDLEKKLQIGMALTVLQMNELYRVKERHVTANGAVTETTIMNKLRDVTNMLPVAVVDLRSRPGCAGGGSKTYSSSFGNTRVGEVGNGGGSSLNHDKYGSLDFECTKGHKNTRPRGQLIPNCTTCGESVAC